MTKQSNHAILTRLIKRKKLLEKDRLFYVRQVLFMLGLLTAGIVLTSYFKDSFLGITLTALFWAFFQTQMGLVGHDIVHRQVFKSSFLTDMGGIMVWNLFLGTSSRWWHDQHNSHHTHPNDSRKDPSINLSLFSFSEEQMKRKNKFQKMAAGYQAYLYFPLMAFMVVAMRISSIKFIFSKTQRLFAAELISTLTHLLFYSVMVWWVFGLWHGVVFAIIHHALTGLYLGLIFAPNHKGMPMLESTDKIDYFSQQVITSRNIRGCFFTDIIYGGLNYQIEHHLFPSMPRNKLKKVKPIIEELCRRKKISYHETGIFRSFTEIVSALHKESRLAS